MQKNVGKLLIPILEPIHAYNIIRKENFQIPREKFDKKFKSEFEFKIKVNAMVSEAIIIQF